jgi:hypothetical protein
MTLTMTLEAMEIAPARPDVMIGMFQKQVQDGAADA